MGAKSHVAKWGTSLAVRIPKAIAQQWGVQEGAAVEMNAEGSALVLRKQKYDLATMLAQITPENLHPETDTGPAQGVEVW